MEHKKAQELLLALVGAYVWVASSDEEGVELVEYTKFQHVMVESSFATHFSEMEFKTDFHDLVQMFVENFEYSADLTKKRISAFASEPVMAEEILRFARAAIVADGKIEEYEEVVLKEIEGCLG